MLGHGAHFHQLYVDECPALGPFATDAADRTPGGVQYGIAGAQILAFEARPIRQGATVAVLSQIADKMCHGDVFL